MYSHKASFPEQTVNRLCFISLHLARSNDDEPHIPCSSFFTAAAASNIRVLGSQGSGCGVVHKVAKRNRETPPTLFTRPCMIRSHSGVCQAVPRKKGRRKKMWNEETLKYSTMQKRSPGGPPATTFRTRANRDIYSISIPSYSTEVYDEEMWRRNCWQDCPRERDCVRM